MELATIFGTIGAIASVTSFTPQAFKIIRARKTDGLSPGMFILTVLAFFCWTSFGIVKGEWTLIIPNSICLLFAGFILVMILLPRRKTAEVAKALDPTTP